MKVQVTDLSKTIRCAINCLESIDFIPSIDKANLLAVLVGDKPSMHTGFFSEKTNVGNVLPYEHVQDKLAFDNIIADLGLMHEKQIERLEIEKDGKDLYTEWVVYCIAKELSAAAELLEARKNNDEKQEGLVLGFPATAVEAYVNDTMLDMDKLPEATNCVSSDAMKFLNHRLSKENWEQEIKYLPVFAQNVKLISPIIYEQCLSDG